MLLEVDMLDRRAADVTRVAQLLVHPVDLRVLRASLAQLESALELGVDRCRKSRDLLGRQALRQVERAQLRRVQDLVRPRAADPGDRALVA